MIFFNSLGKGLDRLYSLGGVLAAICLIGMAACVVLSIISRLLNTYIGGLTEFAGYLMAAANCLALAYTFRADGHIRITLFTDRLSRKNRENFELFTLLAASVITVYLAYFMFRLTYFSWLFDEVSEGSDGLLLWIPQSFAALGTSLLSLSVLHSFIDRAAEKSLATKKKRRTA